MSVTRRLIWTVLATALLMLVPSTAHAVDGGVRWLGSPVAASHADTQGCADVMFLAARGSLEDPPYGGMLTSWRDALAESTQAMPDRGTTTVREVFVDYPAIGPDTMLDAGLDNLFFSEELPAMPYSDSVVTGMDATRHALEDSAARCPDERWVLAGYSQGAQVITQLLSERGEQANGQLLVALLLGNPAHYPGQFITGFGDADRNAGGLTAALHYIRHESAAGRRAGGQDQATADGVRAILELSQGKAKPEAVLSAAQGAHLAIPEPLAGQVLSLCNAGDVVCDAGGLLRKVVLEEVSLDKLIDGSWDTHHSYGPDQFAQVLQRITAELRALVPPAPPEEGPVGPLDPRLILAGGILVVVLAGFAVSLVMLSRRPDRSAGTARPTA